MRSRGLVIAVAFLLAMSATFVVYLYMRGVEERSTGGEMVAVVGGSEGLGVPEDDCPVVHLEQHPRE